MTKAHTHAEHVEHAYHHHHSPDASGIYVISPSGAVADPQTLVRAKARLGDMGFKVVMDRGVLNQAQRFAGTDAQRIGSFARALKQ